MAPVGPPAAGEAAKLSLLAVSSWTPEGPWLRISVDTQTIVYALLDPNVYPPGGQHERVRLTPHIKLPLFPKTWVGSRNIFRISRNPMGVYFSAAVHRTLRGVGNYANMPTYEYLTLGKTDLLQRGVWGNQNDRINVVKSPVGPDGKPAWDVPLALMKIVAFPGELVDGIDLSKRMDVEIRVHERAARAGCAPRFIGLVTESSRVIGYLSEFLPDAKTFSEISDDQVIQEDAEPVSEFGHDELFEEGAEAVPEIDNQQLIGKDVGAVSRLLRNLHSEGVVHGDLHPGNILRDADGTVLLIDFEMATTREDYENPAHFNAYMQWERQRWNEEGLSWLR